DFDGDGRCDFAVGERTRAPAVVWYRFDGNEFRRLIVEPGTLKPEAGGAAADLDGDGDLDLVLGQDASGPAMWWWENPAPHFDRPWKRHTIKSGEAPKHHDQTIADYDGDGRAELLSWNQRGRRLLWFEIPERPQTLDKWPYRTVFEWRAGAELEGFPARPVDVDGDGHLDPVGGGRWFSLADDGRLEAHLVDDAMRFTQCAAGQLIPGGWCELVFSPGDADGTACWYEYRDGRWLRHPLAQVYHGHTCDVADFNLDGKLDILIGEMGDPGAGDDARVMVFYGDGRGNFTQHVICRGQGIHEGCTGDFDGDGDLDILLKPYHHKAPRLEVLWNPAR
ncbi:MAG: VCBS repeat-containing protein, partial [Planctomycetota bacterium]